MIFMDNKELALLCSSIIIAIALIIGAFLYTSWDNETDPTTNSTNITNNNTTSVKNVTDDDSKSGSVQSSGKNVDPEYEHESDIGNQPTYVSTNPNELTYGSKYYYDGYYSSEPIGPDYPASQTNAWGY